MPITTKVERLNLLKRKIDGLPPAAKEEMSKAVRKIAEETAVIARRLAPFKSGKLRSQINAVPGRHAAEWEVTGAEAGAPEDHYGRFHEFGTVKMEAQPFLLPAYRIARRRSKSRMKSAFRRAAKKVAG